MKKGFTLIELLIAIVIIGILLTIVIPKITESIDRSRENSTRANLGNLKTALSMYYGDNEEWPSKGPNGALGPVDFEKALVPDYIDKIPPVMLRRDISCPDFTNYSTITYTNQTHRIGDNLEPSSCTTHGISCMRQLPSCPYHATITNHGGWWYHVGSHTLKINSREKDTVGVFYSDYE